MIRDITKAVYVLRAYPGLDDYGVYKKLVAEGVESGIAARLVEFLPIAYCRLILRNSGARFSNTFFRRTLPDDFEEHMFSSDSVWNAAVAFADEEVKQGISSTDVIAIAARSSEFDAANRLLNEGSKLDGITFASPVLLWPENQPPLPSEE